jgi:hypothetical protein
VATLVIAGTAASWAGFSGSTLGSTVHDMQNSVKQSSLCANRYYKVRKTYALAAVYIHRIVLGHDEFGLIHRAEHLQGLEAGNLNPCVIIQRQVTFGLSSPLHHPTLDLRVVKILGNRGMQEPGIAGRHCLHKRGPIPQAPATLIRWCLQVMWCKKPDTWKRLAMMVVAAL